MELRVDGVAGAAEMEVAGGGTLNRNDEGCDPAPAGCKLSEL